MKSLSILSIVLFVGLNTTFAQKTWNADASHTDINFIVTHMLISEVEGAFTDFTASAVTKGEGFENAEISFTAKTASIDTDNEQRDGHLKSADFFDAATYPEVTFKSKSFKKAADGKFTLTGDLTLHGVTKEVVLNVVHKGTVKDPWGNERTGFKLTGAINRFDYGLKWNMALEAGGLVVGEEVQINCNIELVAAK
ncbi:MAG: YceI family protein [Bacteroidia bacterium]|nr:YceI family protein [Bacteroidia bacterium]